MDCVFRILTKRKKFLKKLKELADAYSEKGFIIINSKWDLFEFLKKYDVEMLITLISVGGDEEEYFYYDGDMEEYKREIYEKFDVWKYEPFIWKKEIVEDISF